MQNTIRSFPSYITWDTFSNTVTYNTKIGVYIVQLSLNFFLAFRYVITRDHQPHTADLPFIPNTHTHTCTLSLSPRVSLHPYSLLSHTIKSEHTPFLVAQNRLIVTFVVTSLASTAYLEVHLLHHKEVYWNSPCSILSDFFGGRGSMGVWSVTIKIEPVSAPDSFILLSTESRAVWTRHL